MSKEDSIELTVIIPARNEQDFIGATISSLCKQDYPNDNYEIIVVDGQSDDNTLEEIKNASKNYPENSIRVFENKGRLSSYARNIAVTQAKGDFILLIDAHVYLPSTTLLTDSMQIAKNNNARVLGRPQPLNPPGISNFQQLVALARDSKIGHSGESYIYSKHEGWVSPISVAVMYRKDVFDEVGMFDTNFDAAEDFEFNYRVERANIKCFISPRLTVHYFPRSTLGALSKQMQRYGYGRALFVSKYPERFTIETIIPLGFVLFVISGPLFIFLNNITGMLWSIVFLCYALIIFYESFKISRSTRMRDIPVLASIFVTIHFGMGYGFMKGIFKKLFRVAPKNA